jgi:uncharacterized protein YndB with AHSA1/START domain
MSETPAIEYVIEIAAPPERVWAGLTSPKLTQQYLDGERIESDWNEGSRWVAVNADGSIRWRGEVLDYASPHLLCYTFCLPGEDLQGSRVRFDLINMIKPGTAGGPLTRLTLTHDEFPERNDHYEAFAEAWPRVLAGLKLLLETGHAPELQVRPAGHL